MSLLCYVEIFDFFTLRPSDLIATLTYILMDIFCPCFLIFVGRMQFLCNNVQLKADI